MIETIDKLVQAIEQMGRMQSLLESYRSKTLPENPRNFLVLAEGPFAQMRQLQAEIDAYLQQNAAEAAKVA